jgi:hypothetical protein
MSHSRISSSASRSGKKPRKAKARSAANKSRRTTTTPASDPQETGLQDTGFQDTAAAILQRAQHEEALDREIQRAARDAQLKREVQELRSQYQHAVKLLEIREKQIEFKTLIQEQMDVQLFRRMAMNPCAESTAILPLHDWHVEETVKPEKVHGLNEYNLDIARERSRRVFQKAVEMLDWLQSFAKIRQLVVPLLGDFISGHIHPELVEVCALSPVAATRYAQELVYDGLLFLLREKVGIKTILIPTVTGNHSRITQKMRAATAAENSLEWLMYHNLEDLFRANSRIQFHVGTGTQNIMRIQDRVVRFSHGHEFNFQGGVGGITIPINRQIKRWNEGISADLDMFGHWHQFKRDSHFVAGASLIGMTPYSMRYGYEPPSQTLAVINRKNGLIFCEKIIVEEEVPHAQEIWMQAWNAENWEQRPFSAPFSAPNAAA